MNRLLSNIISTCILLSLLSCSRADPSWHKLTNQKDQFEGRHNYQLLMNSNLDSIVLFDGQYKLWSYDGKSWKQYNKTEKESNPQGYGLKQDTLIVSNESQQLWKYSNSYWQQLSGKVNTPKTIFHVYGEPTISSILLSDGQSLWFSDGNRWQNLTSSAKPEEVPSFDIETDNENNNSIYIRSRVYKFWFSNGTTWQPQVINLVRMPNFTVHTYGQPTTPSIVLKDAKDNLWTYNGSKWQQVTGKPSQPNWIATESNPYGNPTPTSIILSDTNSNLWQFNGSSWKQISGNPKDPKQPQSIAGMNDLYFRPYINVSSNTIALQDKSNDLWTYDGQNWQKITGKANQPVQVRYLYLNSTPDAIVMFDQNNNIWTYKNKFWKQITGKSGQPDNILHQDDSNLNNNFTQTPDAIVMVDNKWGLWIYNGKFWQKITGGNNQPKSVKDKDSGLDVTSTNVFKQVGTKFIATSDESGNLWIWN